MSLTLSRSGVDAAALACFKRWFADYVSTYYSDDSVGNRTIKLKEEHTQRVCREMVTIGLTLDLLAEDLLLDETMALFHDLGRFPQYATYHTFQDVLRRTMHNWAQRSWPGTKSFQSVRRQCRCLLRRLSATTTFAHCRKVRTNACCFLPDSCAMLTSWTSGGYSLTVMIIGMNGWIRLLYGTCRIMRRVLERS